MCSSRDDRLVLIRVIISHHCISLVVCCYCYYYYFYFICLSLGMEPQRDVTDAYVARVKCTITALHKFRAAAIIRRQVYWGERQFNECVRSWRSARDKKPRQQYIYIYSSRGKGWWKPQRVWKECLIKFIKAAWWQSRWATFDVLANAARSR